MLQHHLVFLDGVVSLLTPPQAALRSGVQDPAGAPKAAIGQAVPEFTFRDFLAGGDGRPKLSDFRGQPVPVVNWTDSDFGRGSAGGVEKLAKELVPVGLVVVLLDTHNKPAAEIEASIMRLYPGSLARLQQNQEPSIDYLDNGPPPDVALIGVDGTLLVAGSYTVDLNKAEKLIGAEFKKLKNGWGASDGVRAARALAFGKRRLGEASASIQAAQASGTVDAELDAVQTEIATRWESWVRSVRYLRGAGADAARPGGGARAGRGREGQLGLGGRGGEAAG